MFYHTTMWKDADILKVFSCHCAV